MVRPHTIRLRETRARHARDGRVIDAKFSEVRGERRTWWGRIKLAVVAVFWAALIGFLIPPAWVLAQRVSAMFAPQ
jgi:hypothetical protein